MSTSSRFRFPLSATLLAAAFLLAGCGGSGYVNATGDADAATRAQIETTLRTAMATDHLRAVIVRITADGRNLYTGAMGESGDGVAATPDMHFRNGAFAFTYIGYVFARLADEGRVSLDDKLARWFPDMPHADQISIRNLLNMTSGYADYVYQPAIDDALLHEPYKQWSNAELLAIGFAAPMLFDPGTNWAYSHTNYIVLGEVLEKITGEPLAQVLQDYVLGPLKLTATGDNGGTPAIPEPVLRSYSAERGSYEDSTLWNPSWTTANGAVETTNIHDLTRSMAYIGSGVGLSPAMHEQEVGPNLIGFGHADPTGRCKPCRQMTTRFSYGLGVILTGPWITQSKNFAGAAASSGYLPAEKLTISVAVTYLPAAFNPDGTYSDASQSVLRSLAAVVAPADMQPGR
jgi:CubicO group peptidase (beta-lactamase class C family)